MSISVSQPLVLLMKKITREHNTHTRLWHLEIFMNHFNNVAGKRLPWAVTQGWSFIPSPLFQTGKNTYIIWAVYIYIYPSPYYPHCHYSKHTYNTSGWWEHWFVTACETFSESKNKCNYSTRWPIFVQASHLTRSPCALHSTLPQLYEGHFKFRPHVSTVLVQLGRGIVSRIIILWYMEVFIWLQGSNVPYQA